jgi:hypothetical protein
MQCTYQRSLGVNYTIVFFFTYRSNSKFGCSACDYCQQKVTPCYLLCSQHGVPRGSVSTASCWFRGYKVMMSDSWMPSQFFCRTTCSQLSIFQFSKYRYDREIVNGVHEERNKGKM